MERRGNLQGVHWLIVDGEEKIATINLAPGVQVYGERLIVDKGIEYRLWDPFRSKLSAAIIKGLKILPFKEGSKVLYLGASTGTTASHVSDIIGEKGIIFCVEISPRVARELMERCVKYRKNMIPIIEDARKHEKYHSIFGHVDLVYCDIAQPDQTDIAIANCKHFLKKNGHLLLAVKSRSIDVTKKPSKVFKEEEEKLEREGFKVEQVIELEPFDKDHVLIHAIME
ncbi:MAG: fibrillarin-like rRNA/tRNA 2'-O-methyltransferase [archaeon]|nr:fibrillarin-like rRNA/tRNA 2'-O-methyltransferase [archaeon]MCP8318043.1 fibrillarin-like rRNA/tRNA 2'-O-methyltransferase [archaeon]MCP8319996.1 fibrillarin-like rRNA/tRNA 2'-O-methyltransferase [archaeon]